jgi:hypothetical protein
MGSSIKLTSFISVSENTVAYEMGRVLSGLAVLLSLTPEEPENVREKTLGGVTLERLKVGECRSIEVPEVSLSYPLLFCLWSRDDAEEPDF